jgi:hypothetical protein
VFFFARLSLLDEEKSGVEKYVIQEGESEQNEGTHETLMISNVRFLSVFSLHRSRLTFDLWKG